MTKQRKRRHESGTPEKEDERTEELKSFIQAKTGEAVDEIKRVIEQRLAGIEDSLNFAYESITATSSKVNALEKEVKSINEDWLSLSYRVAQLEQEREEAERLSRRPQLIFTGRDLHIPENDDRLVAAIAALINRMLELDVPPGQIIYAKRLPRNRVLVKFAGDERGSLRDLVYRSKHKLRGQNIFINENLTPMRQEVLNLLLHEKREGRLTAVLTRGGEVFFAVSKNDRLVRARNKEEAEHIFRQLGLTASGASCVRVSGAAPAPDPSASRVPERAGMHPTHAPAPAHGESAEAGQSTAPTPRRREGEIRPALSQGVTPAHQQCPPAAERPGSGPQANWREDAVTQEARPGLMIASASERATGGPGPDRSAARPSDLGPPLAGQPEVDRPCDRWDADAGGDGRQETGTEPAGASDRNGVASRPGHLDSLAEVRNMGRGRAAGVRGMGTRERSGGAADRDRVVRRTSSVPPGRRSGYVGRSEVVEQRHLPATGERGRKEGAGLSSRIDEPMVQSGGSGDEGRNQGQATSKGKLCDIRAFFQ